MRKILNNLCAAVLAVVTAVALSVSAFADYNFNFTECFIEGAADGDYTVSETEMSATGKVNDTGTYITATYKLKNDVRQLEFWDNPNGTVSVEIRLETEGADVFACMPAFGREWTWVNPNTTVNLKYNEWVTVSESMLHFYEGFTEMKPDRILAQVRGNTPNTTQNITVSMRNFKINGVTVDITPETTTTPATTTTVATTTTTEATTTTPAPVESEPEVVESTESDTTEVESTESEPEQTTATTTTAQTTTAAPAETEPESEETWDATPSTTIDYSQYVVKTDTSDATAVIVAIVIVAAVIVVGAVIGVIIYRKMKFY